MRCREVEKKLSAYSDGELSQDQRTRLESHIQQCNTCRQSLEMLSGIWNLVGELPEAKFLPNFYVRLKARMALDAEKREARWFDRVLIPASAVAIVVFGILVGSIAGKNGEGKAEPLTTEEEMVRSFHLDSFDDFPEASFGNAYVSLAVQE